MFTLEPIRLRPKALALKSDACKRCFVCNPCIRYATRDTGLVTPGATATEERAVAARPTAAGYITDPSSFCLKIFIAQQYSIHYTLYSVYRDKLQNCSCNLFE